MSAVFLKIVNTAVSAGWIVLAVLLLRLLLRLPPFLATARAGRR